MHDVRSTYRIVSRQRIAEKPSAVVSAQRRSASHSEELRPAQHRLRISKVSEDPAAAGRAIILQRGIGRTQQIVRNAAVTESFYAASDSMLGQVSNALTESRATATEAAQNVLSSQERSALALTIRKSIEAIVGSGNTAFRDQQLTGGALTNQPAIALNGQEVLYSGNDAIAQTRILSGELTPVGVTSSEALGLSGVIQQGTPLNAALDRSTRLIDLRGGRGVTTGTIQISDGGNFQNVDLSSATTIGDVQDLLNSVKLNGRALSVTIQADGIQLGYLDGLPGTLAVVDSPGQSMADDLAISYPLGTSPPIVTNGLSPRVTESTLLSKLKGGLGIDVTSGIQIKSGSKTTTIDLSQAKTIGDVIVAINRSGAEVTAELNPSTGGLDIRALRSGVNYSIGENGGSTATDLGLRTATTQTNLSQLAKGAGVTLNANGPEFSITRPDGTVLDIDLEGANTIQDVLTRIQNHPQNQDTLKVFASLNPSGNGIQLLGPPGANPITVTSNNASNAAQALGLVPNGQTSASGYTSGPFALFNGTDYQTKEPGGAIDILLRLETAVREGDIPEIGRLQGLLDDTMAETTRTRGKVGVWSQNIETFKAASEDQITAFKADLSSEIDADLPSVITELTQRQTSLEASMKLIGQTAQISLLDFL